MKRLLEISWIGNGLGQGGWRWRWIIEKSCSRNELFDYIVENILKGRYEQISFRRSIRPSMEKAFSQEFADSNILQSCVISVYIPEVFDLTCRTSLGRRNWKMAKHKLHLDIVSKAEMVLNTTYNEQTNICLMPPY